MYAIYSVLIVAFFVVMSPYLAYQAVRYRKYVSSLRQRFGYLPVTFNLDGTLEGSTFKGVAFTALKITDFGMTLPRVPTVAEIEDLGRMDIAFTATAVP